MSDNRDFVMARLGVVASRLNDGRDMALTALQQFADGTPEEVMDLADDALMCCHEAATALSLARTRMEDMAASEFEIEESSLSDDDDDDESKG